MLSRIPLSYSNVKFRGKMIDILLLPLGASINCYVSEIIHQATQHQKRDLDQEASRVAMLQEKHVMLDPTYGCLTSPRSTNIFPQPLTDSVHICPFHYPVTPNS
jgi:hypothetical protein